MATTALTYSLRKYSSCDDDGRWHTYPSRSSLVLLARPHLDGAGICVYWKSSCLLLFNIALSGGSCYSCVSRNTTVSLKELSLRGAFIRRFQVTVVDAAQHTNLLAFLRTQLGIVVKVQDNEQSAFGLQFSPCASQQFSPSSSQKLSSNPIQYQLSPCPVQHPPRYLSQKESSQQRLENVKSQNTFSQSQVFCSNVSPPIDPYWALFSQTGQQQHLREQLPFETQNMNPNSLFCTPRNISESLDFNHFNSTSSQFPRTNVEDAFAQPSQPIGLEYSLIGGPATSVDVLNNVAKNLKSSTPQKGDMMNGLPPHLRSLLCHDTFESHTGTQASPEIDMQHIQQNVKPTLIAKKKKPKSVKTPIDINSEIAPIAGEEKSFENSFKGDIIDENTSNALDDCQLRLLIVEKLQSKEFLDLLLRVDRIVGGLK